MPRDTLSELSLAAYDRRKGFKARVMASLGCLLVNPHACSRIRSHEQRKWGITAPGLSQSFRRQGHRGAGRSAGQGLFASGEPDE